MSDLATVAFNATVPTSFIKDFFEGLISLENARATRHKQFFDEMFSACKSIFSPQSSEHGCGKLFKSQEKQGGVCDAGVCIIDIVKKMAPKSTETSTTAETTAPPQDSTSQEGETSPEPEGMLADVANAFTEALAKCKAYQEGEALPESAGAVEKLLHEGFASLPKVRVQGPSYSEDSSEVSGGFQLGGLGGFEDMIKAFQPMIDSFMGSTKKTQGFVSTKTSPTETVPVETTSAPTVETSVAATETAPSQN